MSERNPNPETFGTKAHSMAHPMGRDPEDFEKPFFRARLTPFRSLPKPGFRVLIFCVGILCGLQGLFFFVVGAWPVTLFFGLDALLIFGAFWLNYRDGRRYEDVAVSPSAVTITAVCPSEKRKEHRFNPVFSRLSVRRVEDEGVVGLRLSQREKSVEVGGFLNPADRETFARAFGNALATARVGGPHRN